MRRESSRGTTEFFGAEGASDAVRTNHTETDGMVGGSDLSLAPHIEEAAELEPFMPLLQRSASTPAIALTAPVEPEPPPDSEPPGPVREDSRGTSSRGWQLAEQLRDHAITAVCLAVVVSIPPVLLFALPAALGDRGLPLVLAAGLTILVGWLCGRTFEFVLRLPPILGYIAFGVLFRPVEGDAMRAARPYLLRISFVVVLVRGALEVRPADLNRVTLSLALLPVGADMLMTATVASWQYGLPRLEAAMLASISCAHAMSIVIPRMIDLLSRVEPTRTHLARAVLTAAPLECIAVLLAYGACASLLADDGPGESDRSTTDKGGLVVLRVLVSIVVAALISAVLACLMAARGRLALGSAPRRLFFAGSQTEELILTLALALVAYGLADVLFLPENADSSGFNDALASSLVNAELTVVATVLLASMRLLMRTVSRLESSFGAIWPIVALVLGTSLGANLNFPTRADTFAYLLPVFAGLCARSLTLCALMASTAAVRRVPLSARNLLVDTAFLTSATLPRATLQGLLNALPLQTRLVDARVGEIFRATAALTVLFFAPIGVTVSALVCERSLRLAAVPAVHSDRRDGGASKSGGSRLDGWLLAHSTLVHARRRIVLLPAYMKALPGSLAEWRGIVAAGGLGGETRAERANDWGPAPELELAAGAHRMHRRALATDRGAWLQRRLTKASALVAGQPRPAPSRDAAPSSCGAATSAAPTERTARLPSVSSRASAASAPRVPSALARRLSDMRGRV